MSRCRICSANDEEALEEDIARAMWDTQRTANRDNEWRPWEEAGPYWQAVMRNFAAATVKALRMQA